MVANISLGNSLFGALSYNQEKVDDNQAKILCSNLIMQTYDGEYKTSLTLRSFEDYLNANKNTKKPIVHISLNPHPDDKLTDEQFEKIAQEYLEKLGYGNQPYLVYKHEDIDRHHLHIVTTCVKENGERMNGSFEHKRSKDITRELEKKYGLLPAEKVHYSEKMPLKRVNPKAGNIKKQVANIVKSAMKNYHFQNINEYRALLSLYGVTVEEVKGEARGKSYNGLIYSALDKKGRKTGNPFKASLISREVGYDALQKRITFSKKDMKGKLSYNRTKTIVSSCLMNNCSRKQLEKELAKNNISVLFRENDDKRIYGVTFIDHQQKVVFNGSRMGKEFSANTFQRLFNEDVKHTNDFSNDKISNNDYSQQQESITDAIAGIFSMEQHGDNYEEIAFTNRMKRKRKKPRGPKL
ncbi:hypothetical protein M2451_002907 [Dysgonomonas sp. PFB1-18]|uniref:conjugal transfer protein MobB n=1 Tax=unclassified Dysgonomonas TaxID=2630389 RepID=UPI0013D7AAD0|nr:MULTISPECIES: conjugal transfer protein MobB [unclassified Dysgonomonas]MDH6310017.1 hypothetical protein [Dysgonomonas sp. PF1-14]MDH6339926.1 hypothetical protein [Dysgonomonas sp. PF1-16]MDH6381574.1 hypothetical protein [Dysgonomonas sp. PFB1-18]MDH6398789.1 hypothetical protein [Dysgonomonas sp. PF1-23]NDV93633.1 mobilization protein [Dysgonomonas sp. 521]